MIAYQEVDGFVELAVSREELGYTTHHLRVSILSYLLRYLLQDVKLVLLEAEFECLGDFTGLGTGRNVFMHVHPIKHHLEQHFIGS